LTIILTLILGIGANGFMGIGLIVLAMELSLYDIEPLWYVAAAVVIAGYTALLSFIARKLSRIINAAVFILCAQLPSVIVWAASHIQSIQSGNMSNAFGFFVSFVTMAAALIISNKDRLKKWWNKNF